MDNEGFPLKYPSYVRPPLWDRIEKVKKKKKRQKRERERISL